MSPEFKFYFFHADLYPDGVLVSQPFGWKDCKLVPRRHPDYHSVIEYMEGDFAWYGKARKVINEVLAASGPTSLLTVKAYISEQIGTFELLFTGLLDLVQKEEFRNKLGVKYKIKVPIIRDDAWSKFLNRKNIAVDVLSTMGLDGVEVEVKDKKVLPLPCQVTRGKLTGVNNGSALSFKTYGKFGNIRDTEASPWPDGVDIAFEKVDVDEVIQLDFSDNLDNDELKDRYGIPIDFVGVSSAKKVAAIFKTKYSGSYVVDCKLETSLYLSLFCSNGTTYADSADASYEYRDHYLKTSPYLNVYFQKNAELPIVFDKTDAGADDRNSTIYAFNQTLDLKEGDVLRFYITVDSVDFEPDFPTNPNFAVFNAHSGSDLSNDKEWQNSYTYFVIWGRENQIFVDRVNDIFLAEFGGQWGYRGWTLEIPPAFDMGVAPSGEATSPSYLSLTGDTVYQQTDTDGLLLYDCVENILNKIVGKSNSFVSDIPATEFANYFTMKGLHVRGNSMVDKKLFMSLDNWWKGSDPLFCLGLDYYVDPDTEDVKIRINKREFYYNSGEFSVFLNGSAKGVTKYDQNKFIKSVNAGFKSWNIQSKGGFDDAQTKKSYRGKYPISGIDLQLESEFFAAAMAIEDARRSRIQTTTDHKIDEEFVLIAVKADGDNFTPEVGTDFEEITNVLNSDSRYNVRLFVSRNFERSRKFYQAAMQVGADNKFFFSKAEGNYDATSELKTTDYEYGENPTLSEKQDIAATNSVLFTDEKEQMERALSYAQYKKIIAKRELSIGVRVEAGSDYFNSYFIEQLEFYPAKGFATFDLVLAKRNLRIFDYTFDGSFG